MITAAADGSSLSNPGPAGWAWYVDQTCWAAGGWPHGTNNMGELMAVLDLLRQTAHVDEPLHVLCDSQYAINVCEKWRMGWKRKGWKKADGKPILNLELVQALDEQLQGRTVTFEWVKGHAGHALNEAADERARAAATAFRDGHEPDVGPGYADGARHGSLDVAPSAKDEAPSLFDVAEDPEETCWGNEHALLSPVVRRNWRMASALLHPDLLDVGTSGTASDLATVRERLAPMETAMTVAPVQTVRLGDDAILLVWRGQAGDDVTLHSSTWVRHEGSWKLRFQQATSLS